MTREEQRLYLIKYMKDESEDLKGVLIPEDEDGQKRLLRSLMNVRPPRPVSDNFLRVQDSYLREELESKGIVSLAEIIEVQKGIYLWQGDITRLSTDAIVNAANSAMLGCFIPCHGCIDNAIHSAAGVQLRAECATIMKNQKMPEKTGKAKITKGYNLPCRYVLHTVGPVVMDRPTGEDCELLASCYRSCLELASKYRLHSIAFCCISTGEFHFPNELAAEIATTAVRKYLAESQSDMEVVFNVFKDKDYKIYERLLK